MPWFYAQLNFLKKIYVLWNSVKSTYITYIWINYFLNNLWFIMWNSEVIEDIDSEV